MKETKSFNAKVRDFHTSFKQVSNDTPTIPDEKTCNLRLSLILEELTELAEAMGPIAYGEFQRMLFKKSQEVHYKAENMREKHKPSLLEAIDALCDLQYVLSGTIIAMGFEDKFEEAFEEVHNSNMSKACKTFKEATLTQEHHFENGSSNTLEEQLDGSYLCFRVPDKKLLKSIGYRPANLEKFVI